MKVTVITNIWPNEKNPDSGTYVSDQVESLKPFVETEVVYKSHRSAFAFLPFGSKTIFKVLFNKHDLIHAHYGFHSAILPALFSRKPFVVTFHGSDVLYEPHRNRSYRFLQSRVVEKAARIVAVSHQIQTELVSELGAQVEKVCVIPCGVDSREFRFRPKRKIRRHLGLEEDMKSALFIGRLTHAKGVDLIRHASHILPEVNFYFIGAGPIKWQASNCTFLGPLEHTRIPEWLSSADVLLLPSRSEGTPVTVLEALASGVPAICSDVGACAELVSDGKTGVIVSPGDAQELGDAIKRVLSWNEFDPKTGRQMVVQNYDLHVIAKKLYRLYQDVIHCQPNRSTHR